MTNTKDKFSKDHLLYVRKRKLNTVFISFTQIFILVIFFSAWELAARFGVIDSFLMSSPSRIIVTIKDLIYGNISVLRFTKHF